MNSSIEQESAESWKEAKHVASLVGSVPNSFSTCARFLKQDFESGQKSVGKGGRFCLQRLLKSPSFKAPVFYCAATFKPEIIEESEYLSDSALIDLLEPEEMLLALALVYLYRKVKKGCDAEEWRFIEANLFVHSDLGGYVGKAIPAIGFGRGLVTGTLRHLALAMFLGIDKANFSKYRRALKPKGLHYDLAEEFRLWGCTHAQVASIMVQPFGLGIQYGSAISKGFIPTIESHLTYSPEALSMKVATIWIETLAKTGKVPEMALRAEYYPESEDLKELLAVANQVRQNGSKYRWLDCGPEQITPESCPRLHRQGAQAKAETNEEIPVEGVPEEALGVSADEIDDLAKDDAK